MLLLLACTAQTEPARVDAPADSAAGELALELVGPGGAALVIPVALNGRTYRFVLDTGATLTCVDREVATSLALPEVTGVVGTGAGIGGGGQLSLVEIDSLRAGGVVARDMSACVVDLQNLETVGVDVDGLLGLNFLKEFRVTLDFDRSVVRLEAGE